MKERYFRSSPWWYFSVMLMPWLVVGWLYWRMIEWARSSINISSVDTYKHIMQIVVVVCATQVLLLIWRSLPGILLRPEKGSPKGPWLLFVILALANLAAQAYAYIPFGPWLQNLYVHHHTNTPSPIEQHGETYGFLALIHVISMLYLSWYSAHALATARKQGQVRFADYGLLFLGFLLPLIGVWLVHGRRHELKAATTTRHSDVLDIPESL